LPVRGRTRHMSAGRRRWRDRPPVFFPTRDPVQNDLLSSGPRRDEAWPPVERRRSC
jgi:hypothetical protein